MTYQRAFSEALHPRVPAGGAGGGEFGKASSSKAAAKSAPAKKAAAPAKGTLSYDAKTGRGAGYGEKGGDPTVKTLQTELNRLGLTDSHGNKLAVDGKLGPLTTEAVKAAQKRLGVPVDGKVTPSFLAKLKAEKTPATHSTPHKAAHPAEHAATHHAAANPAAKTPAKPAPKAAATAHAGNKNPHIQARAVQTSDLTDEQCEQLLEELLAGLSDDDLQELGALAEAMHAEGGQE